MLKKSKKEVARSLQVDPKNLPKSIANNLGAQLISSPANVNNNISHF